MKKPEQELAEIKNMMELSTRFLSLSGLAGILAGTYAFIAAGLAYSWVYYPKLPFGNNIDKIQEEDLVGKLMVMAFIVLFLSIGTAWRMSQKKSIQKAYKLWSPPSWRFLQALFIPVSIGGIFCFALVVRDELELIAPATLIFYGLGLLNASNFSLNDIKYLGYCQLILGIVAAFIPDLGLVFWTLGFGLLHIIYGLKMYYKYDR